MCHYTHFTTEKRKKSRVLKAQGLSIRAIAKELGRAPSSVSRKFRRNCYANGDYAAYHADKLYQKRRKNCGRKAKEQTIVEKSLILRPLASVLPVLRIVRDMGTGRGVIPFSVCGKQAVLAHHSLIFLMMIYSVLLISSTIAPRKRLNFLTPFEVLQKFFLRLYCT